MVSGAPENPLKNWPRSELAVEHVPVVGHRHREREVVLLVVDGERGGGHVVARLLLLGGELLLEALRPPLLEGLRASC